MPATLSPARRCTKIHWTCGAVPASGSRRCNRRPTLCRMRFDFWAVDRLGDRPRVLSCLGLRLQRSPGKKDPCGEEDNACAEPSEFGTPTARGAGPATSGGALG